MCYIYTFTHHLDFMNFKFPLESEHNSHVSKNDFCVYILCCIHSNVLHVTIEREEKKRKKIAPKAYRFFFPFEYMHSCHSSK